MPFTTSRRRLLITAPLAIILPAGLITYLGLRSVGLLEQTVAPFLTADIQSHQQTIDDYLSLNLSQREREFGTAFLLQFSEQTPGIKADWIRNLGERFVLKIPLRFAWLIFYKEHDGDLIFYSRERRVDTKTSPSQVDSSILSAWTRCVSPPEQTVQDLRRELTENETENTQIVHVDAAQALTEYQFFRRRCHNQSGSSTLGAFTFLELGGKGNGPVTLGFVYDLDYVREHILKPVVSDIWGRRVSVAEYLFEILDEKGRVISTAPQGRTGGFGSKDSGDIVLNLGDTFPFWKVRYLKGSGIRRYLKLEEFRAINIPLIISAAVIMILAVIQSIRNLARELKLAKMRSDFVARVSHELRTPLGLIRLFAETLEMGRIEDKERSREYLHTITRESERLSKLIDNVLDFSKIEAGQKQYQLVPGSVANVVESVTDSMRFHMARNNLDLQVRIEADLPLVYMDREAIAQALWNLLSNAVKYSGDGRVVEVEARYADGEAQVSVRDHGIGIASNEVKRICQQFYRVDDPRVQERGGSGLGLSVVNHIMEGHSGRLTIESTLGQGSTFSLRLPVVGSSANKEKA